MGTKEDWERGIKEAEAAKKRADMKGYHDASMRNRHRVHELLRREANKSVNSKETKQ